MKKIILWVIAGSFLALILLIAGQAISTTSTSVTAHRVGSYVAEDQFGLRNISLDSVEFREMIPDSIYRLPANTFWVDAASGTTDLKPTKKVWFYGKKAITPPTSYNLHVVTGMNRELQKANQEGLLGVMAPSDQFDFSDMDSILETATLIVVPAKPKK